MTQYNNKNKDSFLLIDDQQYNNTIIKMETTQTEPVSAFSHLKTIQSLLKKEFSKKGLSK